MRAFWVDIVSEMSSRWNPGDEPLYVTLPGADGHDLQLLERQGLIGRAEGGAIAPEDVRKVVAIESHLPSVARLKERFPGLDVIAQPLENILNGLDLTTYPVGKHRSICRGHVINLDLNTSLVPRLEGGQPIFPILRCIEKIGRLHTAPPQRDWALCLTLNATIEWVDAASRAEQLHLKENLTNLPRFAGQTRELFGAPLYQRFISERDVPLHELSNRERQNFSMALVPKRIAGNLSQQGWRVRTDLNVRYGGEPGSAPMVSWIFRLKWEPGGLATPRKAYEEAVAAVYERKGALEKDGSIS